MIFIPDELRNSGKKKSEDTAEEGIAKVPDYGVGAKLLATWGIRIDSTGRAESLWDCKPPSVVYTAIGKNEGFRG